MLSRLIPKRTAFFLCDIQERFRPLIYRMEDVISTANKMSQAAKLLDIPLIVTEQNPKSLGRTVTEIDTAHAKLTVPKNLFSMAVPQVTTFLDSSKIDNVVLFGIESHVCVTQTALDLIQLKNINVYVIADGVSSMNAAEIPLALKRLSQAGAIVTSSESVLFALVKDAADPKFKHTSNLVKQFSDQTKSNLLFQFISSKI